MTQKLPLPQNGDSIKEYDTLQTEVLNEDTGWIPLSVLPGVTGDGGIAYRRKFGIVYLRGIVRGTFVSAEHKDIIMLPENARPDSLVRHVVSASGSVQCNLEIGADGLIKATYRGTLPVTWTAIQSSFLAG